MIRFIKHKAIKDYKIKNFKIKKGDNILKILFSMSDIHISRSGSAHLDIWGSKLEELKRLIAELNHPLIKVKLDDRMFCMWEYSNLAEPKKNLCMGIGSTPVHPKDTTCDFKGKDPEKNCPRYKKIMKEAKEA